MIGIIGGITVSTLIAFIIAYINWLRVIEPVHKREDRMREVIIGQRFSKKGITFEAKRMTFTESDSLRYRIQKRTPLLRSIEGKTVVVLQSEETNPPLRTDGIGSKPRFWNHSSINYSLGEDYPSIEHIDTEYEDGNVKAKLEIHSFDTDSVQRSLNESTTYILETLNNHRSNE